MSRVALRVVCVTALVTAAGPTGTPLQATGKAPLTGASSPGIIAPAPPGTQSGVSIAVDATGQHIVVGMNDFRGAASDPLSLSGFAYSDDGGATFVDGGQLPSPGNQTLFGQRWPQLVGHPHVQYVGACTFIYSSLMNRLAGSGVAQTLAIHRSTDCGHSWTGPIEVSPATNPNGQVNAAGNAADAAVDGFIEVDPDTGRVHVTWSNVTPIASGGAEISTTYSDDILAATPTFAPRRVVAASGVDGAGPAIRAAGGGSPAVYLSWMRTVGVYTRRIAVSRSTDNGLTWSAPADITTAFVGSDQVLGNDEVNDFPSMAVDTSPGSFTGTVYVVYTNNNSLDGADVAFQRSTNGGITFSSRVSINSQPGADGSQWFASVAVDRNTGRVYVFYYDQGINSGDLTETMFQFSDDGGDSWSKPMPLTERPFHAGYGNSRDTPNLGTYNRAVAQGGELFVGWAGTPPSITFTDGQPSARMSTPDVYVRRAPGASAALRLRGVSLVDSGGDGSVDPGDDVTLTMPLVNYAANPLFATTVTNIGATLTTTTPGVTVASATSTYPDAAPATATTNAAGYVIRLSSAFIPGTRIELALTVSTSEGATTLLHTITTTTGATTTLLSEDFESVAPGALPAGWSAVHGAGSNVVPWRITNTFSGSNGAFHPNADDGPFAGGATRWERLFSPVLTVPAGSDSIVVDFDVRYDTEEDPSLRRRAYDGFFVQVADLTAGRTFRTVLAEAFAEEFTTGSFQHYPRHLPPASDPSYFDDMSVWAGDSGGIVHVRLTFPGMAGSTVQLRFEFTQDSAVTCADLRPGHTCGVLVDNVVVRGTLPTEADLRIQKSGPAGAQTGTQVTYNARG